MVVVVVMVAVMVVVVGGGGSVPLFIPCPSRPHPDRLPFVRPFVRPQLPFVRPRLPLKRFGGGGGMFVGNDYQSTLDLIQPLHTATPKQIEYL